MILKEVMVALAQLVNKYIHYHFCYGYGSGSGSNILNLLSLAKNGKCLIRFILLLFCLVLPQNPTHLVKGNKSNRNKNFIENSTMLYP